MIIIMIKINVIRTLMRINRFLNFFQRYVDEMELAIGAGEDHLQLALLTGAGSFRRARLAEHCQIGHEVVIRQFDRLDLYETKDVP